METPPMSDLLNEAREKVESYRGKFENSKVEWCSAKAAATVAQAAFNAERHERAMEVSRGGPRPAPNFVPPKTAAAIAADEAQVAFASAEAAMNSSQAALSAAQTALLSLENRVLNSWRNQLARTIRQLQLEGADEAMAEKLAELRVMCPPESCVRINQRFSLSALVREVLDENPAELHLHTPVNELRGTEGGWAYEAKRAEILAAATQAEPEAA
jgi:hypothetical protein